MHEARTQESKTRAGKTGTATSSITSGLSLLRLGLQVSSRDTWNLSGLRVECMRAFVRRACLDSVPAASLQEQALGTLNYARPKRAYKFEQPKHQVWASARRDRMPC